MNANDVMDRADQLEGRHAPWWIQSALLLMLVRGIFPGLAGAIAGVLGIERNIWWAAAITLAVVVYCIVQMFRWANRAPNRDEMEVRDRIVWTVLILAFVGICCAVISLAAVDMIRFDLLVHGHGYAAR